MPFERDRAFGCVFCVTGKEQAVADYIQLVCPEVRAVAVFQEKYKTVQGQKSRVKAVMLPGYVFFEAPVDSNYVFSFSCKEIIRILKGNEKDWQLKGKDYDFARWIFSYQGLINFSTAYRDGDRIRILSGPLKDLEGMICRVDKRGRSAQVALNFNDREVMIWLNFELIETLPADKKQMGIN